MDEDTAEATLVARRRIGLRAVALSGFAVLAIGAAYAYWTRTPQYSVNRIAHAITSHDVALFEKHVDVESVSARLIDDLLADVTAKQAETEGSSMGSALAAGLIQFMKPRLVQIVREQTIRFIETGSFSKHDSSTDDSESANLEDLSRGLGAKRDSFRGIGHVRTEGKIALVGLKFSNADLDTTLTIEVKMRNEGSYWRVVELTNLTHLTRTMEELRPARLAAINAPIHKQMAQVLAISNGSIRSQMDAHGFSPLTESTLARFRSTTNTTPTFVASQRRPV